MTQLEIHNDRRTAISTFIVAGVFFVVFFTLFLAVGFKEKVDMYLVITEFIFALIYGLLLIVITNKVNIYPRTIFYYFVFFYSLSLAFLLRWLFIRYTGEIFQEAGDSYTYDEVARSSVLLNKSLGNHLLAAEQELVSGSLSLDDYGFNAIVFWVYKLFGVDFGRWMMLLFNAISVAISSLYLSKSFVLLNISPAISSVCVSFFAFYTFFPVTAAVGLKENFFVMIIMMALYYIKMFKSYQHYKYFIFALICIVGSFCFRLPVGVILLLTFLACIIINEKNYKAIIVLSIIVLIGVFIFLEVIFQFVFGISLEDVLTVSENRIGEDNKAGWYIQFLSAFCGPFPNYSRAVQYGIVSSFALQLKCLLNFYAIYAIYSIIRKGEYSYYWLSLSFLMGMIMLSVAAVSLDMRYHVTFFPALILLIGYGLDNTKPNRLLFALYSLFIFSIVFVYNIR